MAEQKEEEEGYEYAAFHHQDSTGHERHGNLEAGVIYQTLEGMTADQASYTAKAGIFVKQNCSVQRLFLTVSVRDL